MAISTKDMACHTWAISGNPANGEKANKAYTTLMDKIGASYDYGGNLRGKDLPAIRQETMEKILALCDERTQATDHTVFVCGGFREGQVCPEHLWIEDHTAKRTYDTFINQDVRVVKKVGAKGKSFKPGCEATAFKAGEIARVPLNGYTDGQFRSLPKG